MELKIAEICREKGLTMKDLAAKLGMDASNLNSSLKGNPTLSRLEDVARALGVEVPELFRHNDDADLQTKAADPILLLNGETYKLTKTRDAARMPQFSDYKALRKEITTFVQKAAKIDLKIRNGKEFKLGEAYPFAMMCMVESFEFVHLLFDPEDAIFYLTLCYKAGKMMCWRYDARNEYNDVKAADGSWDMKSLLNEIINDVEDAVKTKVQAEESSVKK